MAIARIIKYKEHHVQTHHRIEVEIDFFFSETDIMSVMLPLVWYLLE